MGAKLRNPPPTMTPALAGQPCQEADSRIAHQSETSIAVSSPQQRVLVGD